MALRSTFWLSSLLILLISSFSTAFYLPGVTASSYEIGDLVPLHVNALTPGFARRDEQLHAIVSYDYYYSKFRFCRPEGGPQPLLKSLGSIIFGDRLQTSSFELRMGMNETCKALCGTAKFDPVSAKFVNHRVWQGYNLNWLVDGLPAGQVSIDEETGEPFSSPGFPLGMIDTTGQPILNNHWDIFVDYHKAGVTGKQYRVVGITVEPQSNRDSRIHEDTEKDGLIAQCPDIRGPLFLEEDRETAVAWTYSVYWRPSKQVWATRWDQYLQIYNPQIHWFSLVNSSIFVILLITMVSVILLRALRKDIERYNRLDYNLDDLSGTSAAVEDGIQEDSGWKLVHGDVFRSPSHPLILSLLLGNGVQLFLMTALTLLFAILGFLSPSNRGFLATSILLIYSAMGFVGGYVSSRAYKSFGGEKWKINIALTPVLVPVVVFAVFFFLNLWVWAKGSSGAVPFTTMIVIVLIWFLISVPLSASGSWMALRQKPISVPTKVNQIPRQIPPCALSLRPLPSLLLTSVLPFGGIFVELYFIMKSIWTSKIYYMFGFLFFCYALMTAMTACCSILLVYYMLCAEDYRWHWRTFIGAGMIGVYVFVMALGFWMLRISFGGLTGAVLYVGYSALLGFLMFVLAGTIGYIASYIFVRKIYASIKVD